jgi:prephenate dehydrogenase
LKNKESDKLMELIHNANNIRGILEGENSQMVKNEETIVKLYTK